jgi:hypothetical protein
MVLNGRGSWMLGHMGGCMGRRLGMLELDYVMKEINVPLPLPIVLVLTLLDSSLQMSCARTSLWAFRSGETQPELVPQ